MAISDTDVLKGSVSIHGHIDLKGVIESIVRKVLMIDLYTARTPNGFKVSVTLEELRIPYSFQSLDLSRHEQKQDWFLKMNPNGRIPVIIDRANDFKIFESGAIMIYLAEKTGDLLPTERKARSRVMQWLMFQMGGVGPMMGQANVFFRYFPEKYQPAIDRYQNECRRLSEVVDCHLESSEWFADDYSIADIANWCWLRRHEWSGFSIEGLDNLKRWLNAMDNREACKKGINVPPGKENNSPVIKARKIANFVGS